MVIPKKGRRYSALIRRILGKLFLLIFSTMVTLFGAELVLRVRYGGPRAIEVNKIMEFDDVLGWRKVAGMEVKHITDEYETVERVNSKHLRGVEIDYEKPEDVYRVLVLGDSFVEGFSVEYDQMMTTLLAGILQEKRQDGMRVEVISSGTRGYSTDQEYLFYINEGCKYEPDLTVLMFCYNDVWYVNQAVSYSMGNRPKPMYTLVDKTLTLTNVPLENWSGVNEEILKQIGGQGIKGWMTRHSKLYIFVRDKVNSNASLRNLAITLGIKKKSKEMLDAEKSGKDGNYIPPVFTCWKKDYTPEIAYCWDIVEALLRDLNKAVEDDGGQLIVFNVPSSASVHNDVWESMVRQYALRDDWSPYQLENELKQRCQNQMVRYVNPRDAMIKDATEKNRWLYFPKDGHWNVEGNKIVAELLASDIEALWLNELGMNDVACNGN